MEHINFWSVYTDDDNLLGENMSSMKTNTETLGLLGANKEAGLEVNAGKIKWALFSYLSTRVWGKFKL
jgi:hypothetical protein